MGQSFDQNIGRIVRTVRKYNGYNQIEFAQLLSVSQSTLSRLEVGNSSIELEVWGELCSMFSIDFFAYRTGMLEFKEKLKRVKNRDFYGGFRIPRKYRHLQGSTVRSVLPFINLMAKNRKEQKDLIKSLGFDPDYFSILDAPVNLNLVNDLFSKFKSKFKTQGIEKHSSKVLDAIHEPKVHGHLADKYNNSKNIHHQLSIFLKNSQYYELDFDWELLDSKAKSTTFQFKKAEHFQEFKISNELNDFHWNYRKLFSQALSSFSGEKLGDVTFKDKRDSFCRVQISG